MYYLISLLLLVRDDDIPILVFGGLCDGGKVGENALEASLAHPKKVYQIIATLRWWNGASYQDSSKRAEIMLMKRIIPCLDVHTNGVVKGVKFRNQVGAILERVATANGVSRLDKSGCCINPYSFQGG